MGLNNTSINGTYDDDDDDDYREWMRFYNERNKYLKKQFNAEPVFVWVLSVIEIPVMILTLIALCFIVKSRPAAAVFVCHLILSDLIQVISMLIGTATSWSFELFNAYHYSLIAGLYFMACVSFERYLLVSHPIWYKSHQSLKLSCFISVIIWCVPLICAEIKPLEIYFKPRHRIIACLIPYPIIILCFVGTCRGLSRSISLTPLKRKLILGSLFLVLLTYTFLMLPSVILELIRNYCNVYSFLPKNILSFLKCYHYTRMLLFVNPLADCLLYLFMRPDVGHLIKSVYCCCTHQKSKHNPDDHSVVNPQNICCTVVCCVSAQKPESHSLNTFSSVLPAAK